MENIVKTNGAVHEQGTEGDTEKRITKAVVPELPPIGNTTADMVRRIRLAAKEAIAKKRDADHASLPVSVEGAAGDQINIEFRTRDLLLGLQKLKSVLSDKVLNPAHRFVLITVDHGEVTLKASNGAMLVETRVQLYAKSRTLGAFGLLGLELLTDVKLCDSLTSLSVNTSTYTCTLETAGYKWNLRAVEGFRLGEEFEGVIDHDSMPRDVDLSVFTEGLEVAAIAMSTDPTAQNMTGIWFGPDSVRSTDANKIAVLGQGTGSTAFTVPAQMVTPLRELLAHGWWNSVQVRFNARQVEVAAGDDRVVFWQMSEFVTLDPVLKDLDLFSPKFKADRDTFRQYLERSRSGACDNRKTALVTLSRAKDDLSFIVQEGKERLFEGSFLVTWEAPDTELSMNVNAKTLMELIDGLNGKVVSFGVGTFRGNSFIRIAANDRTLYTLGMFA